MKTPKILKKTNVIIIVGLILLFSSFNRNSFVSAHSWKIISDNQIYAYMDFTDENSLTIKNRNIINSDGVSEGKWVFSFYYFLLTKNKKNEYCWYLKK